MPTKTLTRLLLSCILALLFALSSFAQADQKTKQDIERLLTEKASRTPTEQKMDSRLLQALRESRGQKMVPGVDLEPANVNADAAGNLKVEMDATVTDSLLLFIKQKGGAVIFSSAKYNSITAQVNFSALEAVAARPDVRFIRPAEEGQTVSGHKPSPVGTDKKPAGKTSRPKKRARPSLQSRAERVRKQLTAYLQQYSPDRITAGLYNSQGDAAHRANNVRTDYGVSGQGVRIGVLSDSYNFLGAATTDVLLGDLPGTGNPNGYTTPVTIQSDLTGSGSDEGRAMLQIVHDLAPKAQLFFATAFISEASFAANIEALRNPPYNCDVIIDDIFYYAEPTFQDGIVAQAVQNVVNAGAFYFSSAGNEGSVAKGTAGYWEGDFNDAGSLVFTGTTAPGTVHNWGTAGSPVDGNVITANGNRHVLIWADPYYASANDYDLFLVSSTGAVKAQSTNVQSGTQRAFEQIVPPTLASGDRLVVFKKTAAAVRAFSLNTFRGRLTSTTTGQTHGHSSVAGAYSVAAASALQTGGAPFSAASLVESFSSDGLRRIFYNANGTPVTPGNVLFATNGGTVRAKPDVTAADGVSTTLSFNGGLNPFYGTSAAAPHAGAIAGLLKSATPSLTQAQLRTALTSTALDVEGAGFDNISGQGIVQAYQAVQAAGATAVADVSLATFTPTEAAPTNNSGAIDPREGGRLVVQLRNPSAVSATAVLATLTTATTGVTVTQGSASYGTLIPGAAASNTATPFAFTVAGSVTCGTPINFTLTVSYGNGGLSPQSFPVVVRVGDRPQLSLTATLGTPAASTTLFTSATGNQTGRLVRSGVASVCGTQKANPGLQATTGSRLYDAYTFTNTTGIQQCVTLSFGSIRGLNLYAAVYNNGGFVPSNPSTNFLADFGSSGAGETFGFNVLAGETYTVVVHEVNSATAAGFPYQLFISSNGCTAVALPVTWLSFNAKEKSRQSVLQWKVANEVNVHRYEAEYSADGINFTKLATVPATAVAAAEKTYDALHPFPAAGNNWYRIKQVDHNGHFTYSKTALVKLTDAHNVIIAPNPASSFVTVQSRSVIQRIRVLSLTGQLVLNAAPQNLQHKLLVSGLAAGAYTVEVHTASGITRYKLVKE